MSPSIFSEKSAIPDDKVLSETLAGTAVHWEAIKNYIRKNHGDFAEEWKFYGAKSGWTLKVLLKKRNLFFFIPSKGSFAVAFVFGDKAVSAVGKSDVPENVKETLSSARKYAEGRGIRVEVTDPADVETVKKLVAIKIGH